MEAIAIASVHKRQYSETFIHNHVELLPYQVHYLYGGYLPSYYNDGMPLAKFYHPLLHPVLQPALRNNLVEYLQAHQIKAVLAEYGPVGVNMLPVCEKANIPLLVYFHGYDIYRADILNKYLTRYQELFGKASVIFAVSKEMAMRLIELGAPSRKVVLNPCGANLNLFRYHDAGRNEPVLFAAGRFEPTKNPLATIEAFAMAQTKMPNARLRMAGNGSLLPKAKRLIQHLGLERNVDLLGVLTPIEVSEEMAMARAFVQHSVTAPNGEKEGAPVAIMEAGATGLPVVSTRHAGIRDIVVEHETGYLVDEGDVPGMAYYMQQLLMHPEQASEMGISAQQRIIRHFSLEKNIRLLSQYIEQVIEP